MKQIKFYLTQQTQFYFMYLLFTLSMHAAHDRLPTDQIFSLVDSIESHPRVNNRPPYVTITCTTSYALNCALKQSACLTFTKRDEGYYNRLIAHYKGLSQSILCTHKDPKSPDLDLATLDLDHYSMFLDQDILVPDQNVAFLDQDVAILERHKPFKVKFIFFPKKQPKKW